MEKFLEKIKEYQILCAVILIVFALIICTNKISNSFTKNSITTTGSYSQNVISDNAKLEFELQATGITKSQAYKEIEKQKPIVLNYLKNQEIKDEDIEIKAISNYPTYENNQNGYATNKIAYYNANQVISIKSDDVQKIKKISTDISKLIDKGVNINTYEPQYFYSKLSDLKIKMLEEAAKDAKQRASAMLKATNNHVGKIQNVRMGVFQITPVNSNDVSSMGINDTSTIEKKITSVANVTFSVR